MWVIIFIIIKGVTVNIAKDTLYLHTRLFVSLVPSHLLTNCRKL